VTAIIELRDLAAPEVDVYARLSERELRSVFDPGDGLFIAESPKVIGRALDAGYEPVSLLAETRQLEGEAKPLLARLNVPVYTAPQEALVQLTGFHLTRGVLCAMRRRPEPPLAALCAPARRVAVREDVMNPTNVGAIFRSAAALGMDAVLLTRGCADPLYRRSIRVSMGNVFLVPWTHAEGDWCAALRAMGFRLAAMALREDALTPDDPSLRAAEKLAVVLGTEGDGLAARTIADCDCAVRIPMARGVDSLNVAAASAVAFWALGRREDAAGG